jgi:anthranilate synthase component 1
VPALRGLHEDEPAAFLAGVARIQDYIGAGDVFQVNLSRGWQAEFATPVPAAALFARLMQRNPAPFSALLQMDEWAIVSSSPERLARLTRDGVLETRPIAGTHPRSEDAARAALRAVCRRNGERRTRHAGDWNAPRAVAGQREGGRPSPAIATRITSNPPSRQAAVFDVLRAVFPAHITGCPMRT